MEWGIFPRLCHVLLSVLSQTYEGDITIVPEALALRDLLSIFTSPGPAQIQEAILRGECATWPKLSIIKNHTWIELKLDQILYRLKVKLLDSNLPQDDLLFDLDSDMISDRLLPQASHSLTNLSTLDARKSSLPISHLALPPIRGGLSSPAPSFRDT